MNVHLDVLEIIFEQLGTADLAAAALVSREFLAGALPALYSHIEYTTHHAKRAYQVLSPFATLAAHNHLPVHVKRIAVHDAPVLQPSSHQVCPAFLRDLALALRTSTNLRAFVCTPKILAPLLPPLLDKDRLSHLRVCASLGSRQVAALEECKGLQSLSLDFPSWNVIDVLPRWTVAMQKTLAHLTLFMTQDIDATVFKTTLAQLPRLRGLHVIGCPRITHTTVLKALSHTPELRELSLTIFPSQENVLPPLNFSIPPITHLSIDVRASYPYLKSLIARIISRLSPRDALAICGGWIGEIKDSSESSNASQDTGAGSPNSHVVHGHVHLGPMPPHGHGQGQGQGQGHEHGHDHANDLPLLTPPNPHHPNTNPNQHAGPLPPNPGNPIPFIGFPFPFPPSADGEDEGVPHPGHPFSSNPELNSDQNSHPLISSFPLTLSVLHLPQTSPAALKEVLDRCQGIQLLGIVLGTTFSATTASSKAGRTSGRPGGRIKPKLKAVGVRPEINTLANILSRARALRELIVDTNAADLSGGGNGPGSDRSSGSLIALLTPLSVRLMMRESPRLRRIVGEGRVWESPTPAPSTPIPFPRCIEIELTLTKARYGPGAGNNHTHGMPGFGTHGGGHSQMEGSNDHWFWLAGSESGRNVHGEF